MKKITCDICKKDMGGSFQISGVMNYGPLAPNFDSGFMHVQRTEMDICAECRDKIQKAVDNKVKELSQ